MASFLSSNGQISVHFVNVNLTLSAHAYSEVQFPSMLSSMKSLNIYFYDVITNELY